MTTPCSDLLAKLQAIISQTTPLLPPEELRSFVQYYFGRRDHYLEGLKKHPAPIYLLESEVLKARALQFQKAFQKVLFAVSFYFAVKSNNHPDVAKTLLEAGFGLDVSSGIELEMALGLGARDIVFSGPGKTTEELQLAVDYADQVVILMDSFGELRRLEAIAAKATRARCGVRLTVNSKGLWRKFGIAPEVLPVFWNEARRCKHIQLQGLQFHSSWNLSPDAQIDYIRILGSVLGDMPVAFRREIEFIDIGGGYWPPQGEWLHAAGTPEGTLREALGDPVGSDEDHYCLPATPIEEFAHQIGIEIHKHLFSLVPCRICLEPGRWICNDAMHLLITVVDKKAPDLVITDAGTNALGWERFETDYFPVLNLTRPSLKEKRCHILGSLCTPRDVWGHMYFGDGIEPGDILMIPTQGAYTYSLRQNFIKPLPTVHTI
ncbi:MAG: diaminopimelate decarboxylase family protein [Candidatus Hodarchaeota archaeon]